MLRGKHIHLRPFEPDDAGALHTYLNRSELVGRRYLPGSFTDLMMLSHGQVDTLLKHWADDSRNITLGVALAEHDVVIGHVTMWLGWDAHSPGLSLALDPNHWRKGFGTEVVRLCLAYLFKQTVAHNVSAGVADWNEPGLAFMQALNFTEVGRMRRTAVRNGTFVDEVQFDMLRPEWKEK